MTILDKLVAAARNDALDAAADTCRDVGATDAERLIRSMRSVVAPPASAYGIDLDALSSIPEQGVGVPVEVTAHKIVYAVHRMQRDKKAVDSQVRFVMSVLAPSHPAAVAVTDEMVERACRHTEQGWDAYLAKGGSYLRWADERRAEMRQTLVAALVDRDRVK